MWTCTVAGTFFTVGLEVGDVVIAEQDDPTLEAHWTIVNKDLDANSILAALLTVDTDGSGLNSTTLQSAAPDEGDVVSTIVKRDANSDITAGKFRTQDSATGSDPTHVMVELNTGYMYKQTKANFISNLGLAILASPAFSGNPTAPTQTAGNDSTRLATTAFVTTAIALAVGGSGFTSGTSMLFQQTSAPSGWTKQTTHTNKAMRLTSGTVGTGGTETFTGTFAASRTSNTHTLTDAQMPSHNHTITLGQRDSSSCTINAGSAKWAGGNCTPSSSYGGTSNTKGSDNTHSHGLPTFAVQYVDFIIANKD
jgi:hypothetical protein